jgi:hypothetical protein
MSQSTARHDAHAKSGDEDVADPPARRPAPRQGSVSPDEPDEGEFELIGDDDLGAADLGPAAPNFADPDAGSGRIRKVPGRPATR